MSEQNRPDVDEMKKAARLGMPDVHTGKNPAAPKGPERDLSDALGIPKPAEPGLARDESSGGKLSLESLAGAVMQSLADPKQYAVLGAEARRGLKDLQSAVLDPFPPGHIAQHEEPGTIANPTQIQVTREQEGQAGVWGKAPTFEPNRDRDRSR